MAKGTTIGFLNFGIDGDNKEMLKKLEQVKKEAVSIEQLFKSISNTSNKTGVKAPTYLQTVKANEVINQSLEKQKLTQVRIDEVTQRTLNNQRLGYQRLQTEIARTDKLTNDLGKSTNSLNDLFLKIGGTAAFIQLSREVINVRGQIQELGIAFETMLGSKAKSQAMLTDIKDLALATPFTLIEVADNTKQLIAMGIAADKAVETVKMLGDVAAGVGVPLSRIAINYGQVSALGKLQSREIRDFAMAGIPIVEQLATSLGKTRAEISDMVESSKIGFPEVEEAFRQMSGEGGKFHNLMEKTNSSVRGQMSKLMDELQLMFNAIGESNEGVIYGAIDMSSKLVKNYDVIGKTLIGLIATYGVYRTALILNAIATQSFAATQFELGVVLTRVQKIWRALTVAMSASPYAFMATVVAGLVATVWALNDATTAQESAQNELNKVVEASKNKKTDLGNTANELINIINSETKSVKEQILAYKELQKEHLKYLGDKSFEDFKKLTPKEQQQIIERSSFELSDTVINETLNKYKQLQNALNNTGGGLKGINKGVDLLKEISKELGIEGASSDYIKRTLTETIKLLEEQKKLRDEAGKDAEKEPKAMQDQIFAAKKQVQDLKEELKNLRGGIIPEASKNDASFNFAKNIEGKLKEIADAENNLNILLYGKTTKDISKDVSKDESAYQKQIEARQWLINKQAELDNEFIKNSLDAEQKILDIQDESFDKKYRQNNLNYAKELLQISEFERNIIKEQQEAAKKKYIEKHKTDKGFDFAKISISDLNQLPEGLRPEDIKRQIDNFNNVALESWKKGNKLISKNQEESLKDYADYEYKRLDIEKKFNEDVARLRKEREQAEKNGNQELAKRLTSAIAQATKQKGEELITLDFEQLKKTPEYVRAFENLKNTSTETLNSLLGQLEQAKQAAVQVLTPDQLREYTSTIESIMNELISRDLFGSIDRLKKEAAKADRELIDAEKQYQDVLSGKNTSLTAAQALQKYNEAKDNAVKANNNLKVAEKSAADQIKKLGEEIENVGNAIGGTVGEIISLMGSITNTVMFAVEGVKSVAATGAAAISTVEKASVILAIIGAALQIATKIASLFAADYSDYNKAKKAYESYIAVLDKVIEKQKELAGTMTGENARNSYEYALELIKKQEAAAREIGLIFAGSGASAGSHSKGRRAWDRISDKGWAELAQWNKEKAGMAYDAKNVDWLFGLSAEELLRLQETAPTFWAQLGDDIGGYLQAIIDSGEATEELKKMLDETYTGLSFDSLKDSFDDLIKNADTSFGAISDSFEDHMQNAVLNFVKNKYLITALEEWYSKFADAYSDGVLSDTEVNALRQMYEEAYNKAKNMYDSATEAAGINKNGNSADKDTLSKGAQALTEDTGNLIGSYLNAIRADVAAQRVFLLQLVQLAQVNSNTFALQLAELIKIQVNTLATANNTNRIAETTDATYNLLRSATLRGSGTVFNLE